MPLACYRRSIKGVIDGDKAQIEERADLFNELRCFDISTPIAIPDIKCVTPSFSMRLMICSLRVFLRSMQRSSSSLKPNGRFCGRCPVKAQVFIFFFIS